MRPALLWYQNQGQNNSRKPSTNIADEHRRKNSQPKTIHKNRTAYQKDYIPWITGLYFRVSKDVSMNVNE